ncbi:hypothetical protein V491_09121 [Pseudogymnoascus sp. VKM F-3775]|nr:hypothetical protein V491_09121 [Pseudogymnoascus sp. VKM F-3775]
MILLFSTHSTAVAWHTSPTVQGEIDDPRAPQMLSSVPTTTRSPPNAHKCSTDSPPTLHSELGKVVYVSPEWLLPQLSELQIAVYDWAVMGIDTIDRPWGQVRCDITFYEG